jgi:hypothetical protein
VREFLEKHYVETSGRDTIKLAIRALMETVEAGSKSIEVSMSSCLCWGRAMESPCASTKAQRFKQNGKEGHETVAQ